MWIKSENGEPKKPASVERTGNTVILRKDFRLVPGNEEKPGHYEYMEWHMSESEYAIYKEFETKIQEQDDALIELAGIIAEV